MISSIAPILGYIFFYLVWLYALYWSVSYSGIDTDLDVRVSIHWLQVLFWIAIGSILAGSTLSLIADNIAYLSLIAFGVAVECLVATWIYLEQLSWDEQAMSWRQNQRDYLRMPRTETSILAFDQLHSGRLDRFLYWGLTGIGIAMGLIYWNMTFALALCTLSFATHVVISQCRHLRYVAVTKSDVLIRYGTPPIHLRRIGLVNMLNVDQCVKKDSIQLTLQDDQDAYKIKLSPQSDVIRIVLSSQEKSKVEKMT